MKYFIFKHWLPFDSTMSSTAYRYGYLLSGKTCAIIVGDIPQSAGHDRLSWGLMGIDNVLLLLMGIKVHSPALKIFSPCNPNFFLPQCNKKGIVKLLYTF